MRAPYNLHGAGTWHPLSTDWLDDDEQIFHFGHHQTTPVEYVTITEPDGKALPLGVVSCHG